MKDTTLKQLVRDRNGQPRGMVVATVIDGTIRFGWSHTNTKAGDRFDKCKALTIALGRAENGWGPKVNVPVSTKFGTFSVETNCNTTSLGMEKETEPILDLII
jgi:hypothetical protein